MEGARQAPMFSLRMPKELKDFIQQKARDGRRSLNSELLHIIEKGAETLYGQKIETSK